MNQEIIFFFKVTSGKKTKVMGVLDIYGFEVFQVTMVSYCCKESNQLIYHELQFRFFKLHYPNPRLNFVDIQERNH